jgi:hypothetical protein
MKLKSIFKIEIIYCPVGISQRVTIRNEQCRMLTAETEAHWT